MITVEKDMVPFDIDQTLILHKKSSEICPLNLVRVKDTIADRIICVEAHRPMIRLLEEEHASGKYIVAWSRGGAKWAAAVITALGLTDKVNLVLTKPLVYFDDKEANEWMQNRVYIEPGTVYKGVGG